MLKNSKGFTIIELVTVIILLGILAVAVVPKFDGTSSYEAYTFRDQLISALRLTQQRAMQNTDNSYCNQLVIESRQFGVPDRTDCTVKTIPSTGWTPDATGHIVDDRYEVTFGASPNVISFDSMGRPLEDCAGGCSITVSSTADSLTITIESEGYIHAI